MSHLDRAAERIIAVLRTAGVRITEDPRSLNPPSVLVSLEATQRRSTGTVAVTAKVTIVAPGPPNLDARRKLDELASTITPALDRAGLVWASGLLTTIPSPSSGEALAAYELTLTLTTEV